MDKDILNEAGVEVGDVIPFDQCECGEWQVGQRRCECGAVRVYWDYITNSDGTRIWFPAAD